jgi:hypothetical protein
MTSSSNHIQPTLAKGGVDPPFPLGRTQVYGSLTPAVGLPNGMTRLEANIEADAPFGSLSTTVSAGFVAGVPRANTSRLTVSVGGTATIARCLMLAAGGMFPNSAVLAASSAFLSIIIEEWSLSLPSRSQTLIRSHSAAKTVIFNERLEDDYKLEIHDNESVNNSFSVPTFRIREYICRIVLEQGVDCHGQDGFALAGSNVLYEFGPVFYEFT